MNYSQDEHEYNELKAQFQAERDAEPYYPFTTTMSEGRNGFFINFQRTTMFPFKIAMVFRPDELLSDELWKELVDAVVYAVEGIQHGTMGEQRRGGE
jgi:hypothetical protein